MGGSRTFPWECSIFGSLLWFTGILIETETKETDEVAVHDGCMQRSVWLSVIVFDPASIGDATPCVLLERLLVLTMVSLYDLYIKTSTHPGKHVQ